jgi:hypothetical protein
MRGKEGEVLEVGMGWLVGCFLFNDFPLMRYRSLLLDIVEAPRGLNA